MQGTGISVSLNAYYIYENAAIVKRESTSLAKSNIQLCHLSTQPVDPETSIRRQSGMSIFRQDVAIRKRISKDTCKLRAYPDFGVTCLLAAGSRYGSHFVRTQ